MRKNKLKILALIPARSGSKGIPRKNIVSLGGYPLIAYSIAVAKLSKYINRVVVTTDDMKIAAISRKFGAEVPFLRPKNISGDNSLDLEFFKHALSWLKKHENYCPDLIVHLRPTSPLREAQIIDKAIQDLLKDKRATSLRSAEPFTKETPYKLFRKDDRYCSFFGKNNFEPGEEYYNYPRQRLPITFRPNGYVDVVIPKIILRTRQLHGKFIKAFIVKNMADIDTLEDLQAARKSSFSKEYQCLIKQLRKINTK